MSFLARFFPEGLKPYAGRIVMTVFGLISAILFLTLGFWRTLVILVLCVLGYMLGRWEDGALDVSRLPIVSRRK